jgi:hypothetical protein
MRNHPLYRAGQVRYQALYPCKALLALTLKLNQLGANSISGHLIHDRIMLFSIQIISSNQTGVGKSRLGLWSTWCVNGWASRVAIRRTA